MTIASNFKEILSFPHLLTNLLDNLSSQDKRALRATCPLFQQIIPAPVSRPVHTFRLLAELDLSHNEIDYKSDFGIQAIGNSLSALTALTSLDLSSDTIDYWSNNSLQAISSLTALTSLEVDPSKP